MAVIICRTTHAGPCLLSVQVLRAERHAQEQGSKPVRAKKEGKAAVKAKAAKQKAGVKAKQGAVEQSKAATTAAAAKAWLGEQLAPVSVPAKRLVLQLTSRWPSQPQLLGILASMLISDRAKSDRAKWWSLPSASPAQVNGGLNVSVKAVFVSCVVQQHITPQCPPHAKLNLNLPKCRKADGEPSTPEGEEPAPKKAKRLSKQQRSEEPGDGDLAFGKVGGRDPSKWHRRTSCWLIIRDALCCCRPVQYGTA